MNADRTQLLIEHVSPMIARRREENRESILEYILWLDTLPTLRTDRPKISSSAVRSAKSIYRTYLSQEYDNQVEEYMRGVRTNRGTDPNVYEGDATHRRGLGDLSYKDRD